MIYNVQESLSFEDLNASQPYKQPQDEVKEVVQDAPTEPKESAEPEKAPEVAKAENYSTLPYILEQKLVENEVGKITKPEEPKVTNNEAEEAEAKEETQKTKKQDEEHPVVESSPSAPAVVDEPQPIEEKPVE